MRIGLEQRLKDAYRRGQRAKRNGLGFDCPYYGNDRFKKAWIDGYDSDAPMISPKITPR